MTITGIITAIIIGAIIGALGRLVVPGRQPIPIWLTIVVGIVAAFIGTWLAGALGISTSTPGIDWLELLVQVIVAAIGVVIVANLYARRGVRGRRTL
ncbi:MAG: GlsB/YeaQ/YmgE family stress response membrane protein [Pseudonocardia sp.]|nr:GlsB/YeaQ/YmgE family stress response membrane protein [Pseudonocardia sp.]